MHTQVVALIIVYSSLYDRTVTRELYDEALLYERFFLDFFQFL